MGKYVIVLLLVILGCQKNKQTKGSEITKINFDFEKKTPCILKDNFEFVQNEDGYVFLKINDDSIRNYIVSAREVTNVSFQGGAKKYRATISYSYIREKDFNEGFNFIMQRVTRVPIDYSIHGERVFLIGDTVCLKNLIAEERIKIKKHYKTPKNDILTSLHKGVGLGEHNKLIAEVKELDGEEINTRLGYSFEKYHYHELRANKYLSLFRSFPDHLVSTKDQEGNDGVLYFVTSHRDFGTELWGKLLVQERLTNVLRFLNISEDELVVEVIDGYEKVSFFKDNMNVLLMVENGYIHHVMCCHYAKRLTIKEMELMRSVMFEVITTS